VQLKHIVYCRMWTWDMGRRRRAPYEPPSHDHAADSPSTGCRVVHPSGRPHTP